MIFCFINLTLEQKKDSIVAAHETKDEFGGLYNLQLSRSSITSPMKLTRRV